MKPLTEAQQELLRQAICKFTRRIALGIRRQLNPMFEYHIEKVVKGYLAKDDTESFVLGLDQHLKGD